MRPFFSVLISELVDDVVRRRSHMRLVARFAARLPCSQDAMELDFRGFVIKSVVPEIYATWEGFVFQVGEIMMKAINFCCATVEEIELGLLTYALHAEINLGNERKKTDVQAKFVEELLGKLSQPFQIAKTIKPKANITYKVLNAFLKSHCVKPVSNKYDGDLAQLNAVRNLIVHGSVRETESVSVSPMLFNKFVSLVSSLMDEITENVRLALREETFYRKSAG